MQCKLYYELLQNNRNLSIIDLSFILSDQNVFEGFAAAIEKNTYLRSVTIRNVENNLIFNANIANCFILNNTIKCLAFYHVFMSPEHDNFKNLLEVIKHNTSLVSLTVFQCHLNQKMLDELMTTLKLKDNLLRLKIDSIYNQDLLNLDSLNELVEKNTSLEKIIIGSFPTNDVCFQGLTEALAKSSTLKSIYIEPGLKISEEQKNILVERYKQK